jgi:hypothetical protein
VISRDAVSVPRNAARERRGVADGRIAGDVGDHSVLLDQRGGFGQPPGQQFVDREHVGRKLQLDERAGVTSPLDLQLGQGASRVEIPQLGGEVSSERIAAQPEHPAHVLDAVVDALHSGKRSGEGRHRRSVAIHYSRGQCVENQVSDPRLTLDRDRGPCGHRDDTRRIVSRAGKDRGTERFQIRFTRQAAIERLEMLGSVDKYSNGVGSSPLIERDLSPQVLHPGGSQLIGRAGLDRGKEREGGIQGATAAFAPGRGELAFSAPGGVGREACRPLEQSGGRQQATAR